MPASFQPEKVDEPPLDGDRDDVTELEELPCTDEAVSDELWEVFIPDDDELEPEPGLGDFWIEESEEEVSFW